MNQREKLEEATVRALRHKLYESENIQNRDMNLMLRNPEKYGERLQNNGYNVTINGQKFTKQLMNKALKDGKYEIQISKDNGSDEHQTTYIIKNSDGKMYVSNWDDVSGRYDSEITNKGAFDFTDLLDKRPARDKAYNDFVDWYDNEQDMAYTLDEPEPDYNDLVKDYNNINTKSTTDVREYKYNKKHIDELVKQIDDLYNKIEDLYKNNKDGSNDEAIEDAKMNVHNLEKVLDEYEDSMSEIFDKHKK